MPAVSTGPDAPTSGEPSEEEGSSSRPPRDRVATVLLPLAVGLVFLAVLISERGKATRDLQIFAPNHATPGASLPVRAILYRVRDAAPIPLEAEVRVELRSSPDDAVVAEAELVPSPRLGTEGHLTLPDEPGTYRIVAEAREPEREEVAIVSRRVVVRADANPSPLRGRPQTEPQQWRQHRVRGPAPPVPLDVRVAGGDCGLGEPCPLLIWVGEPAASIRLETTPTTTFVPQPGCPAEGSVETSGIVRCAVRARGGEADVVVVATRGGEEVGRRRVVLPMTPGAPMMVGDEGLARGGRPTVQVFTRDAPHAIVDLLHERRWVHTQTVPTGEPVVLEHTLDTPGWWRVQARTDPFDSGRAAAWDLYVTDAANDAVGELAARPEQSDWNDPFAAHVARHGPLRCAGDPCSRDRQLRFLLTAPELEIVLTPGATSGAAQWNLGMNQTRSGRRWLAAALIVIAGLFVAIVVVRRGARASREAARILALERDGEAPRAEARLSLDVLGAGLFVLAAFCVAAALVLSRGCM